MNTDDLLRKRLSALTVPEPDPTARDRALEDAIMELRTCRSTRSAPRRWGHPFPAVSRRALVTGAAALLLLTGLGAMLGMHRTTNKPRRALTAERALLSQMESLFGPQLDAVIEISDRAPDIHLATQPADTIRPSLAQPVLIRFHRIGGGTTRVLSYSGRAVCVTLGGRRVCFEPLITGRGEVILSGETFCWTPSHPDTGFAGYQVTAQPVSRS